MDFTLESSGAHVVITSSCDPRFTPESIIDGDETTFWTSTGAFPQEIVIQLASPVILTQLQTWTMHARTIRIEVADGPMAKKWSCVSSVDVQDRDTLQVETHSIDREDATFVKIVIESGWRDFVSLHRVASKGKGSREAK